MSFKRLRYLALGLAVNPTMVMAASITQWQVCPPNAKITRNIPSLPSQLDPQATYVEADSAEFVEQGDSRLTGDVLIAQTKQALRADSATYNKQTQAINAQGNVQLSNDTFELNSERINYNFNTSNGEIFNAYYQIPTSNARGNSTRILREGQRLTRLKQATYTTCPAQNETWTMQANDFELRHEQGVGIARHVKLRIKNIPVFYFPYFSFPLEEKRKSGFLTPQFKSDNNSGLQVSFPYYFNLAPNYDATLAPTLLSQRGVGLNTEFRYLQKEHSGNYVFNVLPNDRKRDKKNRYQFDIDQKINIAQGKRGTLTLRAGGVSDKDYLNDFGGSLAATSTINIERNLTYQIGRENWSFNAIAQDFQILTTDTDAYTRLPQLTFNFTPRQKLSGIQLKTETEYTYFYSSNQAKAQRLNVKLNATRPLEKQWGFLRPALTLNHTSYQIDRTEDAQIQRTLPTLSLDAGLIFERKRGDAIIQTLEPRAFYTYTPYKDQSAIPIFDAAEKTLTYNELFAENRFSGKDRINDANRLTTSVTTRFQDTQSGRERLRVSAGQIAYFDKREVTLPNSTAQTGRRSELVLEASGELNARTRLTGSGFYDTSTGILSAAQLDLNYKDTKQRLLNVSYGKRKDSFEAFGASMAMPIRRNWKVAAGWDYDIANKRTLETLAGVEYESCCWKTRVAARRYRLADNVSMENAIFVEFELRGLGSLGKGARSLLQDRITGYQ